MRLGEHGQQDDPSTGRYEVRDPGIATIEHEAQFAQRADQLTGERLVEQRAKLGKSVDVELGASFRVVVESEVPGSGFVLKLDLASRHSVHAIIRISRSNEIDDLAADQLERFPVLIVLPIRGLVEQGFQILPTFRTPQVTIAFDGG